MPELEELLVESVKNAIGKNQKIAVLFSGGLDSSVIAKLASNFSSPTLFTVGFSSSKDILHAEKIAKELNLPLLSRLISKKEISTSLPVVQKILKKNNLDNFLQLQIALPEFLAFKAVHDSGFKHVLTGLGADSLFLGFDYFREMLKEKGEIGVQQFQKNQLDIEIWRVDVCREKALATYFGLTVEFPFLDQKVIQSALKIPISENIHSPLDRVRKHVLRTIAMKIGVPSSAATRPKSAIQYGSGIAKELGKMLKN